jgi:4-hydroxybenzoate polyprenyltransferase
MLKRLALVLDSIKIAHSVFALPFALLAMLVAAGGWPAWTTFGLIIFCMVTARSAAMAFNRLVDRRFDARNPRTAKWPSVTGKIGSGYLTGFVAANGLLFWVATWFLNPVCFRAAPAVLAILLGYSLSKRFTCLCHFWLGLCLGLAPVGAHLAVTGHLNPVAGLGGRWGLPFEAFPLLLAVAVLLWTAGFDLIYACQDHEVDVADPKLHSMPKTIGVARTLVLSAALHGLTVALLAGAGVYAGMGVWYYTALAGVAGMLIYEHWIVRPNDLSRVNVAFFTLNGAVSILLFAAVLVERVLLVGQ